MTIEDKSKENFPKDFKERMKLIVKYPIKANIKEVKCQPYEIEGPVVYPCN